MKKKTRLERLIPYVLCASMLTFVAACGSDDDDDNGSGGTAQQEQQEDQGFYRVNLTPLNESVSGTPSGTGTITILADEVLANVRVEGTRGNTTHLQHIHLGDSCPTMDADANGDGIVDVNEGLPSYGPILIPLDDELDSQAEGSGEYPSSNSRGSYSWTKTGSLARMLADLRDTDENPEDALVKLPAGEDLNLAGRVITIHGVPEGTQLPDSVTSLGDQPATRTLPIACGVIERVTSEEAPEEDEGQTTGGTTGQTTGGTTGQTTGGTTGQTTGGTTAP